MDADKLALLTDEERIHPQYISNAEKYIDFLRERLAEARETIRQRERELRLGHQTVSRLMAEKEAATQRIAELEGKLTFIRGCAVNSRKIAECEVCADIEESLQDDYPLWKERREELEKRAINAEQRIAELERQEALARRTCNENYDWATREKKRAEAAEKRIAELEMWADSFPNLPQHLWSAKRREDVAARQRVIENRR